MKYIDNCKDKITLSQYYFLTHGHTQYGSFGFRPFDNIANKPEKKQSNIKKITQKLKLHMLITIMIFL